MWSSSRCHFFSRTARSGIPLSRCRPSAGCFMASRTSSSASNNRSSGFTIRCLSHRAEKPITRSCDSTAGMSAGYQVWSSRFPTASFQIGRLRAGGLQTDCGGAGLGQAGVCLCGLIETALCWGGDPAGPLRTLDALLRGDRGIHPAVLHDPVRRTEAEIVHVIGNVEPAVDDSRRNDQHVTDLQLDFA